MRQRPIRSNALRRGLPAIALAAALLLIPLTDSVALAVMNRQSIAVDRVPAAVDEPSAGSTADHPVSLADASRQIALGVAMVPWDIDALDSFTTSVDGHVPALWAISNSWGASDSAFPTDLAQMVAARGSVPMIWWLPITPGNLQDTTYTNLRIINGDFDGYIRQWARDAASFGSPVVLRLMQEMDGDWFPWGVGRNGNTASNFIDAWRHIWNIVRGPGGEGAANVRFLWSPYIPNASVYPGSDYVDYVGFTAMNWVGAQGQPWRSMNSLLAGLIPAARQFHKPIIVAELGCNPVGGDKARWIQNGYRAAYAKYQDVVAIVYLNVDTSPGQADWRLSTPGEALNAYRAIVDDQRFQGTIGPPGAPTKVKATPGDMSATVSWTAAAANGGGPIATYTITSSPDAKTCATNGALSCNVSGLTNGKPYTFTVVATNIAGPGPASAPSAAVTPGPTPTISIGDASVSEGSRKHHTVKLVFTVTLSQLVNGKVRVHYTTANGTATAISDYVAKSGTLKIKKGHLTGKIVIEIKSDRLVEPNEILYVNLSNPFRAVIGDGQGVGTIINDD